MTKLNSVKFWDLLREESALRWFTEYLRAQIGSELELKLQNDNFILIYEGKSILCLSSSRDTFDIEKLAYYSSAEILGFRVNPPANVTLKGYVDTIPVDAISLIFFCLTRFEELFDSTNAWDKHGRFSAKNSHAFRHNYLHIPIVDLWIQEIAHLLGVTKTARQYRLLLTHDVDRPLKYSFKSQAVELKFLIKCVMKFEIEEIWRYLKSKAFQRSDPYNTFDFIITNSCRRGVTSWFSFVMHGQHILDPYYKSSDKFIKNLIAKIIKTGHEIGLHASYDSIVEGSINSELQQLSDLANTKQYSRQILSCRMHYLRWNAWITSERLQEIGLKFDYSCGYADHPGFRCGTCREYAPYNPLSKATLDITVIPTILMDVSLWGKEYMNFAEPDQMLLLATELIDQVKRVDGVFNLLWHNSDLEHNWQKKLYLDILDYAA